MLASVWMVLLSVLPGQAGHTEVPPIYEFSPQLAAAIRGQTPTFEPAPAFGSPPPSYPQQPYPQQPYPQQPTIIDPNSSFQGGLPSPYAVPQYQDPFLMDPSLAGPITPLNGPEPFRFGLTPRFQFGILPKTGTNNPDVGSFGYESYDFQLQYSAPLSSGWILSHTPQLGARTFEGPSTSDIPGSVFRLGWNFQLASPGNGPASYQFNFNPSINSDFANSLSSDAWQFDVNGMMFYRSTPEFMWVLGFGFLDRVHDIYLPYAGVVWTPNDRWEFRLLFPKGRISYFMGNFLNGSHWLYVDNEYHVEEYQIGTPSGQREQMQLQDYRLSVGVRSDHGWYDKFFEFGYVYGRNVDFKRGIEHGFDGDDAFQFRMGVEF